MSIEVVWKYECQGYLAAVLEELAEVIEKSWQIESVSITRIGDDNGWRTIWQGIVYYTEEEPVKDDVE